MIRLRNRSEEAIQLASSGASLSTTAQNFVEVALVPADYYVKAVMGRLGAAPAAGSTVINIVRVRAGVSTIIATLTFAAGAFTPTYSAVQAAPFALAKGDILALNLTSALATPGGGLAVDVSVYRQFDNSPSDGVIQTDTVLGGDADPLF